MSWTIVKSDVKRLVPAPLFTKAQALKARLQLVAAGRRLPEKFLFFGIAPGDDLLCTTVLRELRRRGSKNVWMVSNYPELFAGMNDAAHVVPVNYKYKKFADWLQRDFRRLEYADFDGDDNSNPPRRHIVAELCARAGVVGQITLRPYLKLSENEKARAVSASGKIVVQSSGVAAKFPMRNKEWFSERFQAVVDSLHKEFEFIQLGSVADPRLQHAEDLRGITTIRQSAAILYHARLYIGGVGFLMHLARAVECPSVIIYGGREAPWQSGYSCNVNLYSALSCAPCWRWNTCNFDRKCMTEITVDHVVNGVRSLFKRPRSPLIAETAYINDEAIS